eukprot:29515-Eustigmatos_ZCMA.PRE.1
MDAVTAVRLPTRPAALWGREAPWLHEKHSCQHHARTHVHTISPAHMHRLIFYLPHKLVTMALT